MERLYPREEGGFFLTTLSVDTDIAAGTDLLGKHIADLQSGIVIGDSQITGTLKYLSDYTGFSGDPNEQKGNFIALHCTSSEAADSISVELINGTVGHPVNLDEDGIAILRISDKIRQQIRFVATKGTKHASKTYTIDTLTLEQA